MNKALCYNSGDGVFPIRRKINYEVYFNDNKIKRVINNLFENPENISPEQFREMFPLVNISADRTHEDNAKLLEYFL